MSPSSRLVNLHRFRRGSVLVFAVLACAIALALLLPGSPGAPAVQAQPKEPDPPQPPRVALRAFEPAVQPSSSVEATALAIAYHALRAGGNDKPSAAEIGKFAADMLNEMSKQRK